MKNKSLIQTNPYLKDEVERKMLITRSVRTSSGVEGIKPKSNPSVIRITARKPKRIHKAIKHK